MNLKTGSIVWAIKLLRDYLLGTTFCICSGHKALESISKIGDHNARLQRWLEFFTAFDYTLEYRKGNANGNAESPSRMPEPATEHSRSGSSSLTPVEDGGIFLIRACGLRTRSSPTPGVGLSGQVPRTENVVLYGLSFILSDSRDFRTHRPRMRIDDLSAPLGRFVAGVSASIATVDRRPGLRVFSPTVNAAFASVFVAPSGATWALPKTPLQRRLSPSALLSRQALYREKIPP